MTTKVENVNSETKKTKQKDDEAKHIEKTNESYREEAYMSIYEPPVTPKKLTVDNPNSDHSDEDSFGTDGNSAVTALAEDPIKCGVLRDVWMPDNFRRTKQVAEKNTKNMLGSFKESILFIKELVLMIFIMVVLPTVDVGTDLEIAVIWFSTRRAWSISIICTLIGHTLCSATLWYFLEPRHRKRYSWIFVISQTYPQYRAAFIIHDFITKCSNDDAKERRSIYDQKIGTIEPFIESVPQVIILTASWFSAWGTLTGNLDDITALEQVIGEENEQTRLGYFDIPTLFYVSFSVSCFSAAWGVTMFFKKGPMRFLPEEGLITLDVFIALLGTCCFILWRMTMLASMVSSTGYLIPLVFTVPDSKDILNGQCNTIVGVETDDNFERNTNGTEYFNTLWNCKNCEAKDMLAGFCNAEGVPIEGSCRTDCDCPPCMPFCSVWEWCQRTARYGRNSKTPMECKELWKTPDETCGNQKKSRPIYNFDDQDEVVSYQSCNMRIWVRYEISNETADWGSKPPIFMQRSSKYGLVWDQQTMQVLNSFPIEKCKENRDLCQDWQIPHQLFCTEPVTAGLLVWIGIFILPTFIFNIIILTITFRRCFFIMILHYPQLLFQGLFGTFLFGPLGRIQYQWGCKKLQLSGHLTLGNCVLTILQLSIGLFILSHNYSWGFLFQRGEQFELLPLEEKTAIEAMEVQLILCFLLLIFGWAASCIVFLRIKERWQLDPSNP